MKFCAFHHHVIFLFSRDDVTWNYFDFRFIFSAYSFRFSSRDLIELRFSSKAFFSKFVIVDLAVTPLNILTAINRADTKEILGTTDSILHSNIKQRFIRKTQ